MCISSLTRQLGLDSAAPSQLVLTDSPSSCMAGRLEDGGDADWGWGFLVVSIIEAREGLGRVFDT